MSEKLRVACVFEGELTVGGGFQQPLSVIKEIYHTRDFTCIPIVFSKSNQQTLRTLGIESTLCHRGLISRIKELFIRHSVLKYFLHRIRIISALEKTLFAKNIDICYFLSPSSQCLSLSQHHFIFPIWDLSHRDFVEFPEVYRDNEFDNREFLYQNAIHKAVAIITDSEYGRKNAIAYYNASPHRIYACHFTPSINVIDTNTASTINIKEKYNISGDYIYYPAQFWSHKNHIYILEALQILKNQGIAINAIFSGSNRGNLQYILEMAQKMGVQDLVHYIGFAPNNEIKSLYTQSLALVMPTYFGPTNIPPLEAFSLGVPVIYSNLPDLKEQVGDAALLCDLHNPTSLAQQIKLLLDDEHLRADLAQKGREQLKKLNATSITDTLSKILKDFHTKRKCWR